MSEESSINFYRKYPTWVVSLKDHRTHRVKMRIEGKPTLICGNEFEFGSFSSYPGLNTCEECKND